MTARLDAAMSATPTLRGPSTKGGPIKIVGDPLFYEPLAVAFDKESRAATEASLAAAVDDIVEEMHADGTLTDLSKKWYDGPTSRSAAS